MVLICSNYSRWQREIGFSYRQCSDEVKGRIPGNNPLPTIRETFSKIRREEARKNVMMEKSNPSTDGSTLVTNNFNKDNKKYGMKDGKPWCDHCKRYYHTRETCWKIHGRPPKI